MHKKIISLLCLSLLIGACGAAPAALRPAAEAQVSALNAQARPYTFDQMGVGKKQIRHLAEAGITNSAQLLEAAKTTYGRTKLVETTGIDPTRLRDMVSQADLMRVKGIGPGQSRLLLAVGVRTAKDLARRNPAVLADLAATLNDDARLLERTPSLETITKWIEEAQALERVVTY